MIPIYRCYLQPVGAGRPRLWAGITTGPCPALARSAPTHHVTSRTKKQNPTRTGWRSMAAQPALMPGSWLWSRLLRLVAIFCSEAVDYVKFSLFHFWIIDWKDKRVDLFTHNIDVLGSCCYVLCNSEHWTYFQGTCIRLYLLEFCSFPTEHMMIITVLLLLFGIYCCVLV